jgi:hypothetical protein
MRFVICSRGLNEGTTVEPRESLLRSLSLGAVAAAEVGPVAVDELLDVEVQ